MAYSRSTRSTRSRRMPDKAVQLVQFEEGSNRPFFTSDELTKVACSPAIRDLPTIVISIGGVARSGKSFMLNLFISYLSYVEENGTDEGWKKSSGLVSGVNWAKSKTAVTLGIWMWNRPFILTNWSGHQIAVLLVDSQGTGDNRRSDVKLDTLITLISLQISTVQILNINMYLRLEELTSLQLCTDYSEIETETKKLFQSLVFLIRNEQSSPPGEDPNMLDEIEEEAQNEIPKKAAKGIKRAFREVTTFCLPYPGKRIANASEASEEQLQVCEIPEDFLEPVFSLCQKMFNPERVLNNFQLEKGEGLARQFELLKSRYESESLPDVQSPADALQESLIWNAYKGMLKSYEAFMGDIIERLDDFNSESAFSEEFDRVLTLGYQILDTDGDADKFSKTKIWKKYETMLSMKSDEDHKRLSSQVRAQVEERLLQSERTARQLQMEDEMEVESDMIRLYEGQLREAESDMRSLELQDKIRREEFDEEIERLQRESEKARVAERTRLQRMIEQRQRERDNIARQRQREAEEQRRQIAQLNDQCTQMRTRLG